MPIIYDEPRPARRPGDFRRRGVDGPPYVVSLTNTRKRKGKRDELIAAARAAGHDPHPKIKVDELHELLGPEPALELYGRPSGYGDQIESMWNLMKHHEREVAYGTRLWGGDVEDDEFREAWRQAGAPKYMEQFLDRCPDGRQLLDRIAATAGRLAGRDIASARGTWVHELTEWAEANRGVLSVSTLSDGGAS